MSQRIIKNLKVIQKKIQKMTKIVLKTRNKKKKNNQNQKSIVQKVKQKMNMKMRMKRMKMKKKNWMMREIMIKSIELMMILMIQMKWMNNISKTMLLIINKTILAI